LYYISKTDFKIKKSFKNHNMILIPNSDIAMKIEWFANILADEQLVKMLFYLANTENASSKMIREATNIPSASISRKLSSLAKHGLITLGNKITNYKLTEDGQQLIKLLLKKYDYKEYDSNDKEDYKIFSNVCKTRNYLSEDIEKSIILLQEPSPNRISKEDYDYAIKEAAEIKYENFINKVIQDFKKR